MEGEPIPLDGGSSPPIHPLNKDYKEQPSNPRNCIECGKRHDTIVEDMRTGERLEEIDKCKSCLFKHFFGITHISDAYRGEDDIETLVRLETPPSLKEWEDAVIAEWYGSNRCMTSDGRNVNMSEELNRLEKELIDGVD